MTSEIFKAQRVRLSSISKGDAPIIADWHNNSEFLRLFNAIPAYPKDKEAVEKWIDRLNNDSNVFNFGIRLIETDQLIGFLEIDGILWSNQVCWFSIAIGDPQFWGKGYGREATQLALTYAFDELNMHRVQLTVFSYNERAIALYEKLGLQREGAYREFVHRNGARYDMYLYGILRHEWKS